jgi:hypothetical protein
LLYLSSFSGRGEKRRHNLGYKRHPKAEWHSRGISCVTDVMSDQKLAAEVKRLNARVAALEKLLERIIRQRPVSEKQLERELKNHGLIAQRESLRH